MNPKTTMVTSLRETYTEKQTPFRAHVDATFDWDAKTWYSGDRPISAHHWIDNSLQFPLGPKMPYLDDIGVAAFYQTFKGNIQTVEGCLSIHSSTDLQTENDLEIELFCKNSSGTFNPGPVEYDSYKTKCLESNGIIAHPTIESIKLANFNRTRHFWTQIERTGPFKGTILQI